MSLFTKIFGDRGHRYENKVARSIGRKIEITSMGKEYYKDGKRFCETDIETRSTAIEVKSGKGSNLKSQLDKYKQVTSKEPIGIAPNMKQRAKMDVKKYYKVFDDTKSLKKYLISKGDGKKRR